MKKIFSFLMMLLPEKDILLFNDAPAADGFGTE